MMRLLTAISPRDASRYSGCPLRDVHALIRSGLLFVYHDHDGEPRISGAVVPECMAKEHLQHRVTVLPQGIFTETTRRYQGNK